MRASCACTPDRQCCPDGIPLNVAFDANPTAQSSSLPSTGHRSPAPAVKFNQMVLFCSCTAIKSCIKLARSQSQLISYKPNCLNMSSGSVIKTLYDTLNDILKICFNFWCLDTAWVPSKARAGGEWTLLLSFCPRSSA